MSYQGTATNTLNYYLKTAFTASGLNWDGDNTSEVENIVDCIVLAAVQGVENRQPQRDPDKPTGPTLEYVRELEAEATAVKRERDRLLNTIRELCFSAEPMGDVMTIPREVWDAEISPLAKREDAA